MGSRSPEEEGADPGAIPVAGRVLSRSAALSVRRGACGAPAGRARRGSGAGAATRSKGDSQPTQCNTLGLGRGTAPSNPRPGKALPWSLITPAAPFSLSHNGALDSARSDSDGGDAVFRGRFRPHLAAARQREAGARQPRPGTAPDIPAEADSSRVVFLRSVYLTGKLTRL